MQVILIVIDSLIFYKMKKTLFLLTFVGFSWILFAQNKPTIEFVSIPAGTFTLGSPEDEPERTERETPHQVTISAFEMSAYEITFAQYDQFCEATGRTKPDDEGMGRGTYAPNAWGLYDMYGNVYEWCSDYYGKYNLKELTNPKGPKKGETRIIRGGCWYYGAYYCRSAYRNDDDPAAIYNSLGFRIVRDLTPKQ